MAGVVFKLAHAGATECRACAFTETSMEEAERHPLAEPHGGRQHHTLSPPVAAYLCLVIPILPVHSFLKVY